MDNGWIDHESMMLLYAYSNYRLGKSCSAFSSFWCTKHYNYKTAIKSLWRSRMRNVTKNYAFFTLACIRLNDDDWLERWVPRGSVIIVPTWALSQQPLEAMYQPFTSDSTAGDDATRSPCFVTLRTHTVGEPPIVVCGARQVGFVGEDQHGKVRASPDQPVITQQPPQLGERDGETSRVSAVDDEDDAVAL